MILKIADILKNLPWSFNSTAELPWLDRSRAEKSLQKARQQRRISEREYQLLDHWRELGYWFIKKALWASQSSIKANAGSLKKFYTFLLEKGLIDKDDLQELKETIKEEMSEWLETLKRYDDPSTENMSDVW